MRTYILFFTLLVSSLSYCQDFGYIVEKALYIPYDSTMGYVQFVPNGTQYKSNILYRFYNRNSERVKCEYVKLAKDTFLYVEYDSIKFYQIRKKGPVFLSADCPREDTINGYVNNDMNQPTIVVTLGCTAIKHGFWEEYHEDFTLSGFYQNDKKHGVWKREVNNNYFNTVYYTYHNDTLTYVRQANFLKTNNVDSLKSCILGRYSQSLYSFQLLQNWYDDTFNDVYQFNKNASFSVERHYNGYLMKEEKGNWEITPQYLRLIFDGGKIEKYKLSFVSESFIVFQEKN